MHILIAPCMPSELRRARRAWPEDCVMNSLDAQQHQVVADWLERQKDPDELMTGKPDMFIRWYRYGFNGAMLLDLLEAFAIGVPRVIALIDHDVHYRDLQEAQITAPYLYGYRRPYQGYVVHVPRMNDGSGEPDWAELRRLIDDEFYRRYNPS